MPAKSKAMRRATAIAEHRPEKMFKRNKGLLKMEKSKLHDFASTHEKGLPVHKRKRKESTDEYIRRKNKQLYGK